ncbi:MAG TPA: ADP-ribosylglycohydrolase family protein, partial [Mycobacterium sp.]
PRQVIAAGMPAASITDDTEQAVMLGELLVAGDGVVDPVHFAQALIQWEKRMQAKGSLDLLGPSTKRAVERLLDGVPLQETGKFGSTNGAAMRITPAGIAQRPDPQHDFIDAVVRASQVTHNTSLGIAAAAAVAMAVSVGVAGGTVADALDAAVLVSAEAAGRGHWVAGGQISVRIRWAVDLLRATRTHDLIDVIDGVIGTSVAAQESVVAAFAILGVVTDPWEAMSLAASVGGDTDTMAALVGAVLGASLGASSLPAEEIAQVSEVNDLDLVPLACKLMELRNR